MRDSWDRRYAGAAYFYGTGPNRFVAQQLDGLLPGRGLFLGEGEGRNAVHAAALGHEVVAVDRSVEGRRKALRLARARGAGITYLLGDVAELPWDAEPYDFAVLCFLHLPSALRIVVHRRVADALRPGGRLILEAFRKEQLGRASGGPPDPALLYDLAELRDDFPGLVWHLAEALEADLAEGAGHRGRAAVVRLAGGKPTS
jgi:SAM-dependent methyltransferase